MVIAANDMTDCKWLFLTKIKLLQTLRIFSFRSFNMHTAVDEVQFLTASIRVTG